MPTTSTPVTGTTITSPCVAVDQPPAFAHLSERIRRLSGRPFGWDGDDGRAPDEQAVADANAFVAVLLSRFIPAVHASGDGEVVFQWREAGGFVEVGFPGDGTISWSVRTEGSPVVHGDDPFDHATPVLPYGLAATIRDL